MGELSAWYQGYSRAALEEYRSSCLPQSTKAKKKESIGEFGKGKGKQSAGDWYGESPGTGKGNSRGKSSRKGGHSNWDWTAEEEKRIDPLDVCAYTFEELVAFYKGTWGRKVVEAYWYDTCEPP